MTLVARDAIASKWVQPHSSTPDDFRGRIDAGLPTMETLLDAELP